MRRMFPNLYRHDLAVGASATATLKIYFSVYTLSSQPITINELPDYLVGATGVYYNGNVSPKVGPTFYARTASVKDGTLTSNMLVDGISTTFTAKYVTDGVRVM